MAGQQESGTIIVGAGQAGLAAAFALRARGLGCRVLESAGSPGESWRRRWDSLRLFTPAQHCSLPGVAFPAAKGSFPTKDQVADYLAEYAAQLPVTTGISVTGIAARRDRRDGEGFTLDTSAGEFTARHVVIATGATSTAFVPALAGRLSAATRQLHSSEYRNPALLPDGAVLVVGAGTSGLEIAIELARDREVWLAGRVPFHVPDAVLAHAGGLYWQFIHNVLTRRTPLGRKIAADFTAQGGPLISVSLADAERAGVRLLPRLEGIDDGGRPAFAGGPSLAVSTVVWATGYRPDCSWLGALSGGGPPVDGRGWPVTVRGEVPAIPGLYFVGLPFQYGLTSSLLGGVGRDAAHVADLIAERSRQSSAATTAAS
ncbi:putative flavoprotein involved in K+ transport [Arthrobacter stackebrandtii]|uniref:Flavoprotein involved in K+ transport n=1 Tax=Arthrobacter stackebrandtii TaxID=272161 RepID=A0ABS4YZH1_9MICC|nr:NAD(P)/FAD-dependent oxidoreductase [Arthrobacter stackebrandtii]MBP2414187.1 putative flavoprotein involved in K+ transport [Arthrobacter stackebrandtii]PYG98949.1 potassium transporter Trk [Arthrobacter stackebrandtii]